MKTISWQTFTAGTALRVIFTIAMVAFWTACSDDTANLAGPDADAASGPAKGTLVPPTISCGFATETSIDLVVTAGSTGAPAGFSVQWMTLAAHQLGPDGISGTPDDNSWYASDDPRICKASFSGNANATRYNLAPNGVAIVRIGDILMDNGASTNCGGELVCSTAYIFRAFAHATNTQNKSNFTPNLTCSTEDCDGGACVYTQGWYKNHGTGACANPQPEKSGLWPVTSLTIGGVTYSESELCSILWTAPKKGDNFIRLMHQLITTRLNLAGGSPTTIQSVVDAAECWLQTPTLCAFNNAWVDQLNAYNNGSEVWGTTHCE
jgi:acyl-CoA synthetase (AMP-forming)/AMP-acid ligase II